MNFNLLNSLILTGIVQGFVFGGVYLFTKKYRNKSSRYLALLIICFSYNNLQFYLSDVGLLSGTKMYQTLYIPMGPLIPIFIYFYVLEFTESFKLKASVKLLLFVPFVIFFGNVLLYKVWHLISPVNEILFQKFKFVNNIQSVFSLGYTLLLIAVSYVHVIRNEKKQPKTLTHISKNFNWLKKTLLILFGLSLFWSFALVKYLTDATYMIYFNILWLGLSFAIYWLGHLGIYKYGIQEERKKIRRFSSQQHTYSITDKQKNEHIAALETLMIHERKFLDPTISLETMANELNISKGHLSRVVNTELQTSFSDYINTLRVEQAKSYLINPEFSNYTLVAIGLEAGFNSKSTFNSTFKKVTGLTPSQYKNTYTK